MTFEEACSEYPAYYGWDRFLIEEKAKVRLFDREIINIGKMAKEKWRKIVEKKAFDGGIRDCSYCMQFHEPEDPSCIGCPIETFTKTTRCTGTPYYAYVNTPTVENAIAMKDFIDEIFVRSLLLVDWRRYYENK